MHSTDLRKTPHEIREMMRTADGRREHRKLFRDWLKARMRYLGMSARDLAAAMPATEHRVRAWVASGEHSSIPRVESLHPLADAIGVPVDRLADMVGKPRHFVARYRYVNDPDGSLPGVLQAWLNQNGLQRQDLAQRCGMDPSQLSCYMQGSRVPGLKVLRRLSAGTGLPLAYLSQAVRRDPEELNQWEILPLDVDGDLGLRLATARTSQFLTRAELARRAGVPLASVEKAETDREVNLWHVPRIAMALGVSGHEALVLAGLSDDEASEMLRFRGTPADLADLVSDLCEEYTLTEVAQLAETGSSGMFSSVCRGTVGLSQATRLTLARNAGRPISTWLAAV